ncbi:hypothetical protein [Alcanivorax profundi]|uniref:hypothetical protein n=1 Tax=Alcanivorax profundi TaxID=2338368 RepID=UPI0032B1F906|tara:strand:- start:4831 stop:5475 length:645 start_codon:yes stop_codon:yes gene_type:complete
MNQDISKLCADSLRNSLKDKYGIKLKATHAHHLVAAFFGYGSKTALKAEKKFPIENLHQAEVIVMVPNEAIDARRVTLNDLPENLPDSYTLRGFIYEALFGSDNWGSQMPPFMSFQSLAKSVVENNEAYKSLYRMSSHVPVHHVVDVGYLDSEVFLTVYHTFQNPEPAALIHGKMMIKASRIAGKIGFGHVKVFPPEKWSGGYVRKLEAIDLNG